jgi:NAD dependent epimerase/dehydratase family enzyme
VEWDGRTLGGWAKAVDRADVIINLAGRSVNCRYTEANLKEMQDSRVESTRAVGLAIENAAHPPRVWLQMSTATIYAHRFDAANDELTGRIGGDETDTPSYWRTSVEIAKAWERAQEEAKTPSTRKLALRGERRLAKPAAATRVHGRASRRQRHTARAPATNGWWRSAPSFCVPTPSSR